MDARQFLPFLLLVICTISAASSIRNGWAGPNNARHVRRVSEYLVPPPPPKVNSVIRNGRLADSRPMEAPGYFAQLMSWLNPFSYGSSPSPPPLQPEVPYSPSSQFMQPPTSPNPPFTTIDEPSLAVYDKPPLPSASFNNPRYLSPAKAKSCNPCNKVPWVPIHHAELPHSRDASFTSPPQSSSLNGDYLPPANHEVPHDVHQAATQEVRAPDFSFVPPLPANGQDDSLINPLLNLHLYPGAVPPLFTAENFTYPVKTVPDENSGYSGPPPPPPPPSSGDSSLAENDSFLHVEPSPSNEYEQSVHPGHPSSQSNLGAVHQELKYTSADGNYGGLKNFGVQDHGAHNDLSSSSTQVSHGHPVPNHHGFDGTAIYHDLLDTQAPFGDFTVTRQPSEVFNGEGIYGVAESTVGPLGNLPSNSSQIDQNPPSYGISSLDQVPSNFESGHDDLFPSSNVVTNSHAPLGTSDGSSVKIEDPVHFEESPLLDFTYRGESRTDSSSIPPTSNAIADFESAETVGTTLAPRDELYGTRQEVTSTKSTNNIQIINSFTSEINDSVTQNFNGNLHAPKVSHGKDVSYISPSEAGYLWPSILSTTSKSTGRESFLNTAVNSYDDTAKETSKSVITNLENANKPSAKQQGVKRNKQVQVIIPYTSQYTPLPFHPLHRYNDRRITYTDETNHDNYAGEESRLRNKIKVAPNYYWSEISKNVTKQPSNIKMNNSIDVNRLQKNIDNWTIQEYSKGTTASTVSLSSANPYLFPSKQIPDKYLTTTEPINHAASSHESNVKTYTLAGFSFNDMEYKSSASNHEESRVQVVENSKSTESSIDASTASTKDDSWQGFSVDISPSNKDRVYVVTPQPIVTSTKSNQVQQQKEETGKEIDKKELRRTSDAKKTPKKKKVVPRTFESIEKAYQVLPQAVNNLAVASTGPESVSLWGIMEHEEFASLDNSEEIKKISNYPKIPVLYDGHSRVSHARR